MKCCRRYRLALFIQKTNLRYLGLVSLRQVKGGSVAIVSNTDLCYVDSFSWKTANIVGPDKRFFSARNADENICREFNFVR